MILDRVRDFVIGEFLPGQDPASLGVDVPLISSGIIDSVGTLKLVLFLEETFGIQIDADDITGARLDSLGAIRALIEAKQADAAASTHSHTR
jgi:acyl carrier protein